jgi:hypothetical protein
MNITQEQISAHSTQYKCTYINNRRQVVENVSKSGEEGNNMTNKFVAHHERDIKKHFKTEFKNSHSPDA